MILLGRWRPRTQAAAGTDSLRLDLHPFSFIHLFTLYYIRLSLFYCVNVSASEALPEQAGDGIPQQARAATRSDGSRGGGPFASLPQIPGTIFFNKYENQTAVHQVEAPGWGNWGGGGRGLKMYP